MRFALTISGVSAFGSLMVMHMMLKSQTIIRSIFDMSISNTEKRTIRPIHPGEMLREDFIPDYKLTVSSLSDALCVSRQTVNELIRENRSLSPTMALRLSRLFGNSAEFWLNAQRAVDLWDAAQTAGKKIDVIKPLVVA